jgi:hypothetical protein
MTAQRTGSNAPRPLGLFSWRNELKPAQVPVVVAPTRLAETEPRP